MLAMVSVWPVSTIAATAPMKAIGSAAITCSEKLTERNMVNSTRNMPASDSRNSTAIIREADCWLWNCPPYSMK